MRIDTGRRVVADAWRASRGTLLFLGLMLVFRSAFADWMVVPTGSMNPTVIEGDRVLVDKRAYGWRLPFTLRRLVDVGDPHCDVVVLASPADGTTLLKRVVAVPGDRVEMRDDRLIVNGVAVRYRPLPSSTGDGLLEETRASRPRFVREDLRGVSHDVMLLPGGDARRSFAPLVLPPDRYLVLGDNRDNSADSRYFGPVSRDAIFGRALRVVVSLDPEHLYRPRGDRLLRPMLTPIDSHRH